MKKISKYIFILIILLGVLSPSINLQAQVTGFCFDSQGEAISPSRMTNEECRKASNAVYWSSIKPECSWTEQILTWSGCTRLERAGAQANIKNTSDYVLLTPLPDGTSSGLKTIPVAGDNALGDYLNLIIKIVIGLCAVLAVFMVFMGGIEYVTSEVISNKEHGKERIMHAMLGLFLALISYTLLYTINPDLLKTDLSSLKDIKVTVLLEPETGILGQTAVIDGKTITACKEEDMVPINLFGHSGVRVNKEVKNNLERANQKWLAIPEANRYKVNTIEGYVCKEVTDKPGYWSAHAFGLALDINAATNPYGQTLKTDMMSPPSFPSYPFANVLVSEGWGWGGAWTNVKDAMHFSKYPLVERGDGNLD